MRWCIFILLILAGCHGSSKPKPPPPNVSAGVVEKRDVLIYVDAIGQAIPPVTVQVRPQVNGKLIAAYIQQGSIVKKGDVLYTIDPRPYQALLEEAKAQLVHDEALLLYAENAVKRYKSVVEDDFISKLTFEQYESTAAAARAQVELDKAAVRAAEINVEFTNIVAPVSGKISFFAVDVGNIMIIDDPTAITAIRPFSPIDILFSISQSQFEMIRKVQGNEGEWEFIVTLPESPDEPIHGKTYFLDNQVNQNTGTILLKGRIDNEERLFWPGEYVTVQVLYRKASDAMIVPPGAVLVGNTGFYVYIIDQDGKAQNRNANVLYRQENFIALESSEIKPGDKVIVDGQINIAPGMVVKVIEPQAR